MKKSRKVIHAFQWFFTVLGVLFALVSFSYGGLGILGGIIILISTFVVSPLVEKVPKIGEQIGARAILPFFFSFCIFCVGIIVAPTNEPEAPETEDTISRDVDMVVAENETTTSDEQITETTIAETTTVSETTTTETTETTVATSSTSSSTSTTSSATTTVTTTVITTSEVTTVEVVTTAPPATTAAVIVTTAAPAPTQADLIHFILNMDTNCVHTNANCTAAKQILPENYAEIDIERSDLGTYTGVYWACGKCSKIYSDELPKP